MNNKNLWIASSIGAVVSLLVSNLPFVNFINCLLCAGFWGSAIFAAWLYRRLGGTLTVADGIKVGALSGLIAGVAGFLLSFIGLTGIQGLLSGSEQFLPADALDSMQDITAIGAAVFNLIGVIMEIGFGALGGLIGAMLFRTDREAVKPIMQG